MLLLLSGDICLHAQGSTRIDEPGFVTIWNLLDILQYCGDRGTFRIDLTW